MRIREPTPDDVLWSDEMEEGTNTSKLLVAVLDGKRVAVRLMVPLHETGLLGKATDKLLENTDGS